MPTKSILSVTLPCLLLVAFANQSDAQIFRRGAIYRPAQQYYHSGMITGTTKIKSGNQPKQYRPKSYNGREIADEKMYKTKYRHVYRPVKNGLTKKGSNGQTLILAEYVGTHIKDPNEEKRGDFQDLQHGSMSQELIKTTTNVKMWKEPFLDGTLRWVPFIPKTPNIKAQVEKLSKEFSQK